MVPAVFLLTATTWAVVKHALSLPAYMNNSSARLALWVWAFVAWNSALWGFGVNVRVLQKRVKFSPCTFDLIVQFVLTGFLQRVMGS